MQRNPNREAASDARLGRTDPNGTAALWADWMLACLKPFESGRQDHLGAANTDIRPDAEEASVA